MPRLLPIIRMSFMRSRASLREATRPADDFTPLLVRKGAGSGKGLRRAFALEERHLGTHLVEGAEDEVARILEKVVELAHDHDRVSAARRREGPVEGAPGGRRARHVLGADPTALGNAPLTCPGLFVGAPEAFEPAEVERGVARTHGGERRAALEPGTRGGSARPPCGSSPACWDWRRRLSQTRMALRSSAASSAQAMAGARLRPRSPLRLSGTTRRSMGTIPSSEACVATERDSGEGAHPGRKKRSVTSPTSFPFR